MVASPTAVDLLRLEASDEGQGPAGRGAMDPRPRRVDPVGASAAGPVVGVCRVASSGCRGGILLSSRASHLVVQSPTISLTSLVGNLARVGKRAPFPESHIHRAYTIHETRLRSLNSRSQSPVMTLHPRRTGIPRTSAPHIPTVEDLGLALRDTGLLHKRHDCCKNSATYCTKV